MIFEIAEVETPSSLAASAKVAPRVLTNLIAIRARTFSHLYSLPPGGKFLAGVAQELKQIQEVLFKAHARPSFLGVGGGDRAVHSTER